MILQVILEGIGLGVLLILVCAIGIRKGAVGMVHLYSQEVQERCVTLGLTTHAKIKRNALIFKAVCVPGYIAYVLVCVYALNVAKGFVQGFWQLLVILSVMNLIDRFWVDGYWVGHTNAWEIPGTEDLKPYIIPPPSIRIFPAPGLRPSAWWKGLLLSCQRNQSS